MELYEQPSRKPLALRMRPRILDEFIGQGHLIGKGKPISVMLENSTLHSMILFGPPACGKTSLAELMASALEYRFVPKNALTLDSEAIRKILKDAESAQRENVKTLLFVDEIHRLYKPKQDAFLSALEEGLITLVGATTENPYFILQPALRSRLFIYNLKSLSQKELNTLLFRAFQQDEFLQESGMVLSEEAREKLLNLSADPRILLNTLELAVLAKRLGEEKVISGHDIDEILQRPDNRYSSKEGHFDTISAFIKSIRGSDIDAALYYLAVMLSGGEDPLFIARRLIISASEDIGLAYPEALPVAVACYTACEKIGMPEARICLAETTALLAGVAKSNSAYLAVEKALADVAEGKVMSVPMHLRNATFQGEKDAGKGSGYRYPHDFPRHFIQESYTEKPVSYFEAGELGFEKKIKEWQEILWGDLKTKNPE